MSIKALTRQFEIGKQTELVLPEKKSGQKLVLEKVALEKIDKDGVVIAPDNVRVTVAINSKNVLDRASGPLFFGNLNTTKYGHEFDANDQIEVNVEEIVASGAALIEDRVSLTLVVDYL